MSTEPHVLLQTDLVLEEGDQCLVQRHQLLCLPHQAEALSIRSGQRAPHVDCRRPDLVW